MAVSPSDVLIHWDNARAVARAQWYLRKATRVGARVRLWGHPVISNLGTLVVADRVRLVSTVVKLELAVGRGGALEIGEGTFINYGTSIAAMASIRIGKRCNIGNHVIMMDNNFHSVEPERRTDWPESAPIVLEENVWLGTRVVVLPGVTIGSGSVIGAGSVVIRDVPPRTLAAGVPAKAIRSL